MSPTPKRRTAAKGADSITFDATDQKILDILQRDCETPINAIASEIGLSVTPCWRRIKRMEEAGVIRARVALVDPARVGVPLTVFIGVSIPRHEAGWLAAFSALVEETPEIVEAYRLTGTVDYLLKVVTADIAAYDAIYQKMIDRLEFRQINSMICMEELKFTTAVPTDHL